MIIPPLQGKLVHKDFFIYTACDEKYFDDFGKALINSIRKNSNNNIHLHLFNPRQNQLDFCIENSISVSHEYISLESFQTAANKWQGVMATEFHTERQKRIFKSMEKGGDKSVIERMQKTYFACARFIRLSELLLSPTNVFSIDVDAIVRKSLPKLTDDCDLYIHKNKQFLAGGLYLTGTENSLTFLKEYASILNNNIQNDSLYWSLDQDVLDMLVPSITYKELPRSLIDWNMLADSYIWTAKGKRKDLDIFKKEKEKYKD